MSFLRFICLSLTSLICLSSALSAEPKGIQVLLVGTYHFSNAGLDLSNVKAVDILSDQRQREVEAINRSLLRFKPTLVAVEWPTAIVDERYAQFLTGALRTSRNEVVQFGFRLAKASGLARVHGVDVDGDFPFDALNDWMKAHGRGAELDALMAMGGAETAKLTAMQDTTTIGGVLRYLNTDDAYALNHSLYVHMLTMGEGAEQPGAAVYSAWSARNTAICARIVQTLRPGDRAVVFFGQGHIHLLRQCLREQDEIEVIDPLKYLKR